jgi:hypothetical protein
MTPGGGFWAGVERRRHEADRLRRAVFSELADATVAFRVVGYIMLKSSQNKDLAWEFYKHSISRDSMNKQFVGNFSTPRGVR